MRWARGAAAVAVALALAGFVAWLLGWSSNLDPLGAVTGEPATVTVPDLSELARPRAVADVESAGLVADVQRSFSLTLPRGAVISQDPAAGARVAEGSTVTVVVSRGVTRVEMPDAVGRPLTEIIVPFDAANVDYVVERVASETLAKGLVIEQSPEPGRRVTAADTIRFVVSSGPDPRAVPPTSGLSPEGAAYALGTAGFTVTSEVRDNASVQEGVVMGSEPAEGTVVPRDTAVVLVVSAGPPPVAVPQLVGQTQEAAVAQLESLGLAPNIVGGGPTGGQVTAQDPAPTTMIRPGAIVTFQIGDS